MKLYCVDSFFAGTPSVIARLLYIGMHVLFYYQTVQLFLQRSAALPVYVVQQQQSNL